MTNEFFQKVQNRMKEIIMLPKTEFENITNIKNSYKDNSNITNLDEYIKNMLAQSYKEQQDLKNLVAKYSELGQVEKCAIKILNQLYTKNNVNNYNIDNENDIDISEIRERKILSFDKFVNENLLTQTTDNKPIKIDIYGKNTFFLLLEILDEMNNLFLQKDYKFNKYKFFFVTDYISIFDIKEILETKKSLTLAYNTLNNIKTDNVRIYFGLKGDVIEYGFYTPDSLKIYKFGEYQINNRVLNNLPKYHCLFKIKEFLNTFKIN